MAEAQWVSTLEKLGFPIGSKVKMIGKDPNIVIEHGEIGVVCHYHKHDDGCDVGVEWEKRRSMNHNCYGKCMNGHGRYVPHTSIALLMNLDFGEIDVPEFSIDALFDTIS